MDMNGDGKQRQDSTALRPWPPRPVVTVTCSCGQVLTETFDEGRLECGACGVVYTLAQVVGEARALYRLLLDEAGQEMPLEI